MLVNVIIILMLDEKYYSDLRSKLDRNYKVLQDNNLLLKKIHRNGVWAFWIRITWYLVLIGLPFALYFYVLEPYFTALGSNYETFKAGIGEIPGLKGLSQLLDQIGN